MKSFLLAVGALVVASASPVLAQDAGASAPVTTSSFTGPRLEIFGGWDRTGVRDRFDDGTTRVTDKGHKDGYTGGGLAGYDMPIGNMLIAGVYGSYALSSTKDCFSDGTTSGCIKDGRTIEGGARIGAKLGGKALVYAKGAYVNGRLNATATDPGVLVIDGHANRDGWRAGAGVEYALNQHTYVKAEYDYTRFKSFDAADLGVTDTSLRFDRNQVLGGFGVRF